MSDTLTMPARESRVSAVPRGYHTITPYLMIRGAAKAIEFYERVLGARERMRMPGPQGRIMHAELEVGDSIVMLADEMPEMNYKSPESIGGSPVAVLAYVQDVDAAFARALGAGARELRPVQNQFYGDRAGTLVDPFGHIWTIATHIEDVSPDEMQRRMQSMGGCCESC